MNIIFIQFILYSFVFKWIQYLVTFIIMHKNIDYYILSALIMYNKKNALAIQGFYDFN